MRFIGAALLGALGALAFVAFITISIYGYCLLMGFCYEIW